MFDTLDRTGTAEFPFPRSVVFRALCEGVTLIPSMKIERRDELASRLDVAVGMSAFSWGEKVSIVVSSKGQNSSTLGVASGARTILGSATVHGKNRKNVALIIAKTSDILKEKGAVWISEMEQPTETHAAQSSLSISDELAKLASLRDQGVLTLQEFDNAKARLLA